MRRRHGHSRLYLQIYLAFMGVVVMSILIAMLAARAIWEHDQDEVPPQLTAAAELLVRDLPEGAALEGALRERGRELGAALTLWSADGQLLATTDVRHEPPPDDGQVAVQSFTHRSAVGVHVRLHDGRWLSASVRRPSRGRRLPFLLVGVLLIGTMALATFPVARRITRRLERLESAVERFGHGDWKSRVPVQGRDEIADLARAFNRAADRIDALLTQQKRVLASASHELRAPLARLRMALELLLDPGEALGDERRAKLLAECEADIAELDALVYDVLLSARLEQPDVSPNFEALDLGALVVREAERAGAAVEAEPLAGSGDARMLRRLLQNLLDNAKKYGGAAQPEVRLSRTPSGALIAVSDRGPGVPEAERERIFEPFYRPAGHREGRDGGVGLGLSLVRQIAEHHGGSARCVAGDGGGSRFEVELPRFT